MKIPTLIAIAGVLVLLATGAFFVYKNSSNTQPVVNTESTPIKTSNENTDKESTTDTGMFTGTMLDLLTLSGDRQCTWENSAEGRQMSGTTYVSGGKYRSDVVGTIDNGQGGTMPMKVGMIGDAEKANMWMEVMGQKMGYVIDYSKYQDTNTVPQNMEAYKEIQQDYNFKCSPWNSDPSKFILPTDVTFTTM